MKHKMKVMIVESDPQFDVVARAQDGQDALDKLKQPYPELQSDIIMTDIETRSS